MTITLVTPDGLPRPDELYRQVSVATGSRIVHVAGQVARDAEGTHIGEGDLAAQVERCYLNLATALDAADLSFDDVAKLTVYLVDWAPEKLSQYLDGMTRAATRLGRETLAGPPLTGIGVAALAEPDLLVEIEAVAVG